MADLRLDTLELQNFRSFPNAIIRFPRTGMFLIQGRDAETGESSGTGKTSVFLALAYALDILPSEFPAASQQSWGKKAMQVILTLRDGKDQPIELRRGKDTRVVYVGEGREVKGAKSYPEELRRLFGVGPEILAALTYREQDDGNGFFVRLGPAEKTEFLTHVLSLQGIEAAVDAAGKEISRLEPILEARQGELRGLQDRLLAVEAEPEPAFVDVGPSQVQLQAAQNAVALARQDIQTTMAEIATLEARDPDDPDPELAAKTATLEQAEAFLKQLVSEQDEVAAAVREREGWLVGKLRTLDTQITRIRAQESQLHQVIKDIAAWDQAKCPTCLQTWQQDRDRLRVLQERRGVLEQEAQAAGVLEGQRQELERERANLKPVYVDPRIPKFRQVIRDLTAEVAVLQRDHFMPDDNLEAGRAELQRRRTHLGTCLAQLQMAEQNARTAELQARHRTAVLADREKRRSRLEDEVAEATMGVGNLEATLNAERDFVALLGREGFLGVIFEEILQEIAREANRRLGRLANTTHVTVDFQTETEKGRRQIQTWVSVRGNRSRLKTGCSGGMQTSVRQIVDLAVVDVISRRSGFRPGWLCLDEISNGQGKVTFEAALEVFREASQDRLVVVIDHGTEVKESFQQTLDIEFKDGVSRVVS